MKLPTKNAQLGETEGLKAREALGLSTLQPLDDILRALERTTELAIFARSLGEDGYDGAYSNVRQRPFIHLNADRPPVRQRFTLAHEFGHHWLEHGTTVDVKVSWADTSPKETQANYFAASFLMPAAAVDAALGREITDDEVSFDTLVVLATQFGVSAKAMRIRLETMEVIRGKQIAHFDALIDAAAHHGLPQRLGVSPVRDTLFTSWHLTRMPPRMAVRVLSGVDRGLFQPEQAAAILRTDTKSLGALRDALLVPSE